MAVQVLAFLSIVIFGFSTSTYGVQVEKPISLQIKDLRRWKNSSEVSAVRQSLAAMLNPRPSYPRFMDFTKKIRKYSHLFQKPFLLLEAESNEIGGFFALVVFKDHPKVYRLWLYEIDKNLFELREIAPLKVTLNKIIMDDLANKRVHPFWVAAGSSPVPRTKKEKPASDL